MEMTTNLPISAGLSESSADTASSFSETDLLGLRSEFERNVQKLEGRRLLHATSGKAGVWTGTKEGMVATVVAVVGAMLFGGAAGDWFAGDQSSWLGQSMRIAGGTMAMAALVSLIGSLIAGRNPIFWGVGMPLLVYVAGSFCAFMSAGAGATAFLFGAPVFCGLAVLAGVMAAFLIDRDN